MLDERSVSWKVFLPNGAGDKVLAIGLDPGGIVGLARTWEKVDCIAPKNAVQVAHKALPEMQERIGRIPCLKQSQEQYSLLVIARPQESETLVMWRIAELLQPDGILVCLGFAGCNLNVRELRRGGFPDVRHYVALPRRQPRVFFPVSSNRLIAKGLGFHSPGSYRGQQMLRIAKFFANFGLRAHLKKGGLVIAKRDWGYHNKESLASYLSKCLNYSIKDLVVYAGSDTPCRKITALAIAEEGFRDLVVKISDTVAGREAIRKETEALCALVASPLSGQVPRIVIEKAEWNGYAIQGQSTVPFGSGKQIPRLTILHFKFLAELSRMERKTGPIESTKQWRILCDVMEKTDPNVLPKVIRRVMCLIQDEEFRKRKVVCHRIHGDFVPWNISSKDGCIHVIDWEDSHAEGPALLDVFHFLYRQASEIGPWPGAVRFIRDFMSASRRVAILAQYPDFDHLSILLPMMLLEYFQNPSFILEKLMNSVLEAMNV